MVLQAYPQEANAVCTIEDTCMNSVETTKTPIYTGPQIKSNFKLHSTKTAKIGGDILKGGKYARDCGEFAIYCAPKSLPRR